MPKVSVVVPVYNAEKTLVACISNLVNQTLGDIELIFVNDASTDGSLRILMDCEKQFSDRVIIVNLEINSGPGGARNAGLLYASGDYIGFADSDDMVDVTMYEKLLKKAEDENADMVDTAYFDEASNTCILQTPDGLCGELDDEKRSELIAGGGYLWSRLFRRGLFEGVKFRENAILEDMEVMMELFMRTKVLANTHDVLYKYSAGDSSASRPKDVMRYHDHIIKAMNAVGACMEKYCGADNGSLRMAFEYSIAHLYEGGLSNIVNSNTIEDKDALYRQLYDLMRRYITVAFGDNHFIMEKIPGNVRAVFEDVDRHFGSRES